MNRSGGGAARRPAPAAWLAVLAVVTLLAGGSLASDRRGGAPGEGVPEGPLIGDPSATVRAIGTATRPRTVLHYRGGLSAGLLHDSSDTANPGRIMTGRGGRVVSTLGRAAGQVAGPSAGESPGGAVGHPAGQTGARTAGRTTGGEGYLRFPGRQCPRRYGCPWAVILTGRSLALEDSQTTAFTFGARVRLTSPPSSTGMTVIQRGSGASGEPQWSLRVDDGRVSCRWSDGTQAAVLPDDLGRSVPLEMHRWYALSCIRRGDRFSLTVVDPVTTWPVAGYTAVARAVGPVAARGPTTIGATALDAQVDSVTAQFHGDLDEIVVRAG